MTDQPTSGLTLRERVSRHYEAEANALDAEVGDLERQLVEIADLSRIGQAMRADERAEIETRLTALRTERDRRRQQRAATATEAA